MNNLPSKTTFELIEALETGKIDTTEAARRIAQIHTAKSESYAQTLIGGMVLVGIAWAITGGSAIIPAVVAFLTWDTYQNQRKERLQAFQHISQGQILEYLPDCDRELFTELLSETQSQQAIQNSEAQDAPKIESETQAIQGIQANSSASVAAKFTATNTKTAYQAILSSPYVSRAFFGFQRTGKTYLAALSSRAIGCAVFHINLMSVGPEDSQYFDHATSSVRCDLVTSPESEALQSITAAIELVDEFVRHRGNAILIIDEIAFIGFKTSRYSEALTPLLDRIADQIAAFSSAGIKRGKALWTIAPEFVATTLVDQVKAMKKLPLCYVTISPGKTIGWEGNAIGFSSETFEQVKNNFTITEAPKGMGCDRIAFINGVWMPLGEMPPLAVVITPETPQQLVNQWQAANPSEVFARAAMAAFVPDVDEAITKPTEQDPEYRLWVWAWQKLARFPDGLTRKRLWDDAPQSIKNQNDRSTFDKYLNNAIEVGCILGNESGPLKQNPDLSPE